MPSRQVRRRYSSESLSMNLLPKASGSRPRLACEIAAEGVTAARAVLPDGPLESRRARTAGSRSRHARPQARQPRRPRRGHRRHSPRARIHRVRPTRAAKLTIVIPDAAVRVLLLDFDALPAKLAEALPIVRFRLKKLLPFEVDDAMVSYPGHEFHALQRACPRRRHPADVLEEYETAVREAGYEPGAVLPSTLAALAGSRGARRSLARRQRGHSRRDHCHHARRRTAPPSQRRPPARCVRRRPRDPQQLQATLA